MLRCYLRGIGTAGIFVASLSAITLLIIPSFTHAATPVCEFASSDSDNDGWGWENDQSCIVEGTQAAVSEQTAPEVVYCQYLSSDDDNDGWGWENNASCKIGADSSTDTPTPQDSNYVAVTDDSGRLLCQSADADPDGDGYGWENNASCIVSGSTVATQTTQTTKPYCSSAAVDDDNDGWGWENNASCKVDPNATEASGTPIETTTPDTTQPETTTPDTTVPDTTEPVTTEPETPAPDTTPATPDTSEPETTVPETTPATTTPDTSEPETTVPDTTPPETVEPKPDATAFLPSDITDLILVTGQSNTQGSNTAVEPDLDAPHPRVFAYTRNGWQVAALHQSWDNGAHPGNGDATDLVNRHNNFALHFGKRLATLDETAVVGFILVSEPGEGIGHWDQGNQGMARTQQKTLEAINALPHKSSLDGILWHQGETDWLLEGTSDVDVPQPAPVDYYPVKLNDLIYNLRLENWFDESKPFICGETIKAEGVNTHLNSLNTDSDSKTACVEGAGLPAIRAGGNHFNAVALRTIGQRYAERYYSIR